MAPAVPETLIAALDQLTAEYTRARGDTEFLRELDAALRELAGAHAAVPGGR
jgi:tryptophan synthase beta subunit